MRQAVSRAAPSRLLESRIKRRRALRCAGPGWRGRATRASGRDRSNNFSECFPELLFRYNGKEYEGKGFAHGARQGRKPAA